MEGGRGFLNLWKEGLALKRKLCVLLAGLLCCTLTACTTVTTAAPADPGLRRVAVGHRL